MATDVTTDAATQARRVRWLLLTLIALAVVLGTLGNELSVQDWDPQLTRNMIERTATYGGTFYENAIFNKGPLEPAIHWLASLVTTWDGYWFGVALFSTLLSLVLAGAGMSTARAFGATPAVGAAVGVAVFIMFSFSDSVYAGVIYTRNITVALLAGAWIIILWKRPWTSARGRTGAIIAISVMLGLAVQSLLVSVLTAAVLMLTAFGLVYLEAPSWERLKLAGIGFVAVDVAILSAPVWYWLRGAFEEFWAGWFTHGRFQIDGLGIGFPSQLARAWEQFFGYHQDRPLVTAIVLAFVTLLVTGWRSWSKRERLLHAAPIVWWVAAWIELTLSVRYSTHYFIVLAVPLMVMAVILIGHMAAALVGRLPRLGRSPALVVITAILAIYLAGPEHFADAVRATARFRGAEALATQEQDYQTGNTRTVRAVLDLVSDEGDSLLGWTYAPWPYLELERISATRFIWKWELTGQIYLGLSGPEYVLPRTWEWFFEDIEESDPIAFIEVEGLVDPANPVGEYTETVFTRVYPAHLIALSLRNDVAEATFGYGQGQPWTPTAPVTATGWSTGAETAEHRSEAVADAADLLLIAETCDRIEGRVWWPTEEEQGVTFVVTDPTGETVTHYLALDRMRGFSAWDYGEVDQIPIDVGVDPAPFSVIIGPESAVLTVRDQVVAGVRLKNPVTVSIQSRASTVMFDQLRRGTAPVLGC